jgi:probable rRNA maturation factor
MTMVARSLGRSKSIAAPLEVSVQAQAGSKYANFLRRHLLRAHAILHPALRELSVALVGDARMSMLHQQFMDIAGPTDVLTFPLEFDKRKRVVSGEVIICVPEAVRQARTRKLRVDRELLLYALHGMLHLCGFDDRTEAAFQKMHRMEDDILIRLGLGPVFAPADSSRSTRALASRRGRSRRA